jgi:NAD+ synthase
MLLPVRPNARSALLVIDMQEFFFRRPERRSNLKTVTENINRLSAYFDKRGFPVVHIATAYQAGGFDWDLKMLSSGIAQMITGTEEAAFLPEMTIQPHHLKLTKTRYSAFFKTNLADLLDALDIQRVVVTGAYTHYCVNATVFDAYAHDFVPGLATDAVTSHLPEESQMIIARMRRNGFHVMTTKEFLMGQ